MATHNRWRLLVVLAALLVVAAASVFAPVFAPARDALARTVHGEPEIVFSNARLIPQGDRLMLDAHADIELPNAVRLGLDSGVPLEFVVELTLSQSRSPWPDKRMSTERWRYRLNYYELTRHYRINAIDGGGSRNYRSLSRALEGLGAVSAELDMPIATGYVATVGMRLDSTRLPLPLQPVLGGLWRGSWVVRGEPHSWSFDIALSDDQA